MSNYNSIEVRTSNSMYKDGEEVGGYHEIHIMYYQQNIKHIIANIDSIIANNLLYGCEDTVLEDVTISCRNLSIIDQLVAHYGDRIGKVKINCEYAYD